LDDDWKSILGDISVGADKKKRAHRAPKSPDLLNEYRWFCAAHIRDYNKSWDFYAGMSPEQIEKAREKDRRWDRPTWEMKGAPGESLANDARKARRRLLPKADVKALEALDLDVMATADEIRERYKTLVKELHPDMNGGDRSEEDRLQKAVAAWNHIKKSASFKR